MKFNYAIAKEWAGTKQLGTYTYFGEVHYGTKQEALKFAKEVSEKTGDLYEVYILTKYSEKDGA